MRTSTTGLTLLEVVVSVSILVVVVSSLSFLFTSMTDVSAEVTSTLDAEMECARALEVLYEDLQATDSLGTGELGRRHCTVTSVHAKADGLVYRKVEGFVSDADADTVRPVFGGWYKVHIDNDGHLTRHSEEGAEVIAARASAVQFSITPKGLIAIELTTHAGRDDARVEATGTLYVLPENLD